jgi:hypothetical protein
MSASPFFIQLAGSVRPVRRSVIGAAEKSASFSFSAPFLFFGLHSVK